MYSQARVAESTSPHAGAMVDHGPFPDLAQFEGALRTLQVPMFNVMYADQAGHILYLFGGRVPVRSCCDFAHWSGVAPGDSSGNLWTATLGYEQLPCLLDPATGWLQNANDPPWTSTVPSPSIRRSSRPGFLLPACISGPSARPHARRGLERHVRRARGLQARYPDGIRRPRARRAGRRGEDVGPALAAAPRMSSRHGPEGAGRAGARCSSRTGCRPCSAIGSHRSPWTGESTSAPRLAHGLADKRAAVAALETAAGAVEKAHGALDVPGDVMRIRYAGKDEPGNGASGDPQGSSVCRCSSRRRMGSSSWCTVTPTTPRSSSVPRSGQRCCYPMGTAASPAHRIWAIRFPSTSRSRCGCVADQTRCNGQSRKDGGAEVRGIANGWIADRRLQRCRGTRHLYSSDFSTPQESAIGNRQIGNPLLPPFNDR